MGKSHLNEERIMLLQPITFKQKESEKVIGVKYICIKFTQEVSTNELTLLCEKLKKYMNNFLFINNRPLGIAKFKIFQKLNTNQNSFYEISIFIEFLEKNPTMRLSYLKEKYSPFFSTMNIDNFELVRYKKTDFLSTILFLMEEDNFQIKKID